MELWIDNTGLQSAGVSLEGVAKHAIDVDGLLQLGTLIVFSEKLQFNGFEPEAVGFNSRVARQLLMDLGLPEEDIVISAETPLSYRQACLQAGNEAAQDLSRTFEVVIENVPRLEPPDLPRSIMSAQTSYLRDSLLSDTAEVLEDLANEALKQKAAGAVRCMLAICPSLRAVVRDLVSRDPGWSLAHTNQLNALLRSYLNEELAGNKGIRYAPAIGRARLLQEQNYSLAKKLASDVDEISSKLRGETLPAPAVSLALVHASRGEPHAVIEAALEYRSKAEPLRKWLRRRVAGLDLDSPKGRSKVRQAVSELRDLVEIDLGLQKGVKLGAEDGLRLIPALWASGLKALGASKLTAWVGQKLRARKVDVLTDISEVAGHPVYEARFFEKLKSNCMRHAQKD